MIRLLPTAAFVAVLFRSRRLLIAIAAIAGLTAGTAATAEPLSFKVGFAQCDITPEKNTPMWGYGARHDSLSSGVLDRLWAKAVVIEAGPERLAIVGMDLGRGPTEPMMEKIRRELETRGGIRHVLVAGSHTHHGPVLELTDRPGYGKGKFDDAVQYSLSLPNKLIDVVLKASQAAVPARIGIATKNVPLNRNRHSKRPAKAVDPQLAVVRFDGADGRPLAVLVNFAAHPVTTGAEILKFSADYPGYMRQVVEKQLGCGCVFMQGASGDMSPNQGEGRRGPQGFGEALGAEVLSMSQAIETRVPERPDIRAKVERFQFGSRVDFSNALLAAVYGTAFFPELIRNFFAEFEGGMRPELSTVLLNGEVAIVAGSGEFFANHAVRLRARSYAAHTLFFGYANGHHMYFPTIEAVSEGGYGADATVSPVEIGAGERMMDRALVNLYSLMGKLTPTK